MISSSGGAAKLPNRGLLMSFFLLPHVQHCQCHVCALEDMNLAQVMMFNTVFAVIRLQASQIAAFLSLCYLIYSHLVSF